MPACEVWRIDDRALDAVNGPWCCNANARDTLAIDTRCVNQLREFPANFVDNLGRIGNGGCWLARTHHHSACQVKHDERHDSRVKVHPEGVSPFRIDDEHCARLTWARALFARLANEVAVEKPSADIGDCLRG